MKAIVRRCFGLTALIAAAVVSWTAHAYEVGPMRIFLDLGAGQTSSVFTIRNIRETDLPVEMEVYRRLVSEDGEQELVPADDDFVIFPPQVLIGGLQNQAVRIQYVGDPALSESVSYVIQVAEVPVVPDEFTGVVFAYNFGVSVYVRAPGAEDRVVFSPAERQDGGLVFTARNDGADYNFLSLHALEINANGRRVTLTPDQVAERAGNPIIPPNATRRFNLSLEGLELDDLPQAGIGITQVRRRR
jgi:fimbrial chaperone protein